ncbi:hypothetical protein ACFWTC_03100 [Streptomyces sp. NPDC058619]|uniref:hypothetical protein n=1 Tax=unclassified Streptomyces TaxID=2593676 RepID=UPI0036466FC8
MTPSEELRAAAETLRAATIRGAITATPAVAALVRARGPLAELLDDHAARLDATTHPSWQEGIAGPALTVARALLATQQNGTPR